MLESFSSQAAGSTSPYLIMIVFKETFWKYSYPTFAETYEYLEFADKGWNKKSIFPFYGLIVVWIQSFHH